MQKLSNFINGEFVAPATGGYLENFEPATGAVTSMIPDSGPEDIAAAVAFARAAFPAWSSTPARERGRLLTALADLIDADTEALAAAESADTGKPITLARTVDIPRSAENLRYFAGAVQFTAGQMHEMDAGSGAPGQAPQSGAGGPNANGSTGAINFTLRRPRGVAGLISPWNLPLYLLTWKIGPALATGNTAVCKPSEVTPMTAHLLASLAQRVGLPPGVLNIVHGLGNKAGAAIVSHADVPTLSFTGSTPVGRWIGQTGGQLLKRVSLELGGKNPFIIFADADLPRAISTAARAAFTNQGQICLCGSRVLVERSIYPAVLDGLTAAARSLVQGDPADAATQQGALVSSAHRDRVHSYVELARTSGGTVYCGGRFTPRDELPERCRNGYFYEPTVVSGLAPGCRVEQEEIFGPVVSVSAFDTEDEAVALANGTPYGLAATYWTGSFARAQRMAASLEAGIIWCNCWLVRDLRTPFGGMKQSGVGREGGDEAIRFFTEPRNVCMAW